MTVSYLLEPPPLSLTQLTMSTITRTLRNLRKIGIKEYAHQMQYIGDTKAGTYIATDKYGNKYYENQDQELPRLLLPRPSIANNCTITDCSTQYEHDG